ncbi:uncharacterized protein LOC62_01G001197 [Vanrija pseudolonga]|uniref:Protein CPL1-like domain-containing protein n=1 Tax=Vanrija pseudolonga TaxID=143232 RepID=A0AAF0Y0C7_9TREE|nr:hypothetical protein LOC62_01G001197 [Vanrija pseudolonga]
MLRPPLFAIVAVALALHSYAHPFSTPATRTRTAPSPLTGCTPSGLSWTPSGTHADAQPILYPASDTTPGWCFELGRLVSPHALAIHAAFAAGDTASSDQRVNVSAARAFCAHECTDCGASPSHCAAFVIARLAAQALRPGALTQCEYPPDSFTPLSATCEYACLPGHLSCGRACYDPLHWLCLDGVDLQPKSVMCGPTSQVCVAQQDGPMACHDVGESVGTCGGCLDPDGAPLGGVNCLAVPGVRGARCHRARCVATRCRTGYVLDGEACQPQADGASASDTRQVPFG